MANSTNIIGQSKALSRALEHLSSLAGIDRPILILGERGTGKELAGERVHFLSPRWDSEFVKVNCGAITETLLESELFGHEAGAFTGATRTHIGRFERADGGTLFLDELGNMSTRLQEKLLRLIEYGEFERVGGSKTLKVDVRVVAATNADLPAMANKGEFRWDLLDRLSFDVVRLPPLRERIEDIEELATHFAVKFCTDLRWSLFPGFSDHALEQMQAHHWPGNVRELKNVVERSLHRWGNDQAEVDEIVINPFSTFSSAVPSAPISSTNNASSSPKEQSPANHPHPTPQGVTPTEPQDSLPDNLPEAVAAYERGIVERALDRTDYHQGETAKLLGISYDQIRGLMRKHGLRSRAKRS